MSPSLSRFALLAAVLLLAGCWKDPSPSHFPGGYEHDDYACSNHRDDDGDGLTDCSDPDCLAESTVCGRIIPLTPQPHHDENDAVLCHDRIDNDENGQWDCGDRSCQGIPEMCCGRELDDATCSDGLDNDQDGNVDETEFLFSTTGFNNSATGFDLHARLNASSLINDGALYAKVTWWALDASATVTTTGIVNVAHTAGARDVTIPLTGLASADAGRAFGATVQFFTRLTAVGAPGVAVAATIGAMGKFDAGRPNCTVQAETPHKNRLTTKHRYNFCEFHHMFNSFPGDVHCLSMWQPTPWPAVQAKSANRRKRI